MLGVGVDPLTLEDATRRILGLVDRLEGASVCVRDAHGVVLCQDDAELLGIHRRAAMVTTDGMPLVRAAQRAGFPEATRVYEPDLMLDVCGSQIGALGHFLYGSTPEVLVDLQHNLEVGFPQLVIVGTDSPPFRVLADDEISEEWALIRATRPDIVWVGLSTPKQECWMAANVDHLDEAVLVGVGAAFDLHAGCKRQAPRGMQGARLQWRHRMLSEPRRLGRCYLTVAPRFLRLRLWNESVVAQQRLSDQPWLTKRATT